MFTVPMQIEKSSVIDCTVEEVFKTVSDFSTWPLWSPWLRQEPSCSVTIEGKAGEVGHKQAWNGDFIGSGEMELSASTKDKSLEYDLTFLKPWKSHSKVGFRFVAKENQTELFWTMQGTLPIFMFFMKNTMSALVGSDYTRGLQMLKEYLEKGTVVSKTEVKGVVDREKNYYVGKRRTCTIADIGPAMSEDLTALNKLQEENKFPTIKSVFSIYHKFDMVSGLCEYTSGFLCDSKPDELEGLVTGQMQHHKALRVDHLGPYRHLGNAWSAAMGCSRSQHKANKSISMYEIYSNNPHEVTEDELKVEIYIPVKR